MRLKQTFILPTTWPSQGALASSGSKLHICLSAFGMNRQREIPKIPNFNCSSESVTPTVTSPTEASPCKSSCASNASIYLISSTPHIVVALVCFVDVDQTNRGPKDVSDAVPSQKGSERKDTSTGCRARREAEIAKSDDGRVRLTAAHLRGLARDEERGPIESAGAPPAIPVPAIPREAQDAPMDDGAGAQAPMDVIGTSRKRNAEETGRETDDADRGGVQPDPGSMAGENMHETMQDAMALGADAVALAEA